MNELIPFSDELTWREHLIRRHANLVEAGWLFVKDLNAGLEQFGNGDYRRNELLEQVAADLNVTKKHLQNMIYMFRSPVAAIATEINLEHGANLSIYHAGAVHGLETEVARDILTTAAENGWSVELTRAKVWAYNHPPQHNVMPCHPPPIPQPELQAPAHQDLIDLAEQVREINRRRWTTTIDATLPVTMTDEEHAAFAIYGKVAQDAAQWWLADHCLQVQNQAMHLRDLHRWPQGKYRNYYDELRAMVGSLYQITDEQFERCAETARLFPPEQRRQNETITYQHHELLRNRTEDRKYYLDRASREGWSATRLAFELKGKTA